MERSARLSGRGAGSGKGFRAKDSEAAVAVLVGDAVLEAAIEHGEQRGAFRAAGGAEGGFAFVEQQGGRLAINVPGEHGRGKAAGEPGFVTQEAEQFQADGLAGLLLGGVDIEAGRGEEGGETMGMDDP
jgi:hypothetical protein